jgi:ABC-2 type transport system permease protein
MQSNAFIPQAQHRPRLYWVFSDTWELFRRNVIHIQQTPGQLITGLILQPVLLTVLFTTVIGGAVSTGEANYINFLLPGILVLNALRASTVTSVSIANDTAGGMIDRFRSLPMEKSAILGGTVLSVAVRCLVSVAATVLVGLLFGFGPQADFGAWLAAIGLLLLVSYAFSWLFAIFGLLAKSVEGAEQMTGLFWIFFFLSSTFVPVETMPGWLQGFANNQPLTQAIDAIRGLLLSQPVGNHAWFTVIWCIGIILVSVPLTGMFFRRRFG